MLKEMQGYFYAPDNGDGAGAGDNGNGDNGDPSTGTQNTEHMIPKSRFDEVNTKMKEFEKELKASKKALEDAQNDRLKEKEEYKELYEKSIKELNELKPIAEQVTTWKETMEALFEAQKAEIPEEMHSLIPEEMSVKQKLDWIAKNKALLLKPTAPNIGAGERGSSGGGDAEVTQGLRNAASAFGLTDEQLKSAAKRRAIKEKE